MIKNTKLRSEGVKRARELIYTAERQALSQPELVGVTCELTALAVRMHRKRYGCTGRGTDAPEEVRMHRKRYGCTRIRSLYTIILALIYTAALPAVERQA
jgi:hypothetical protein